MHCNNLKLVLGLGLVRVSSGVRVRIRVKVRVSVMVRDSIRTSWVVNFALFRCHRPVINTHPAKSAERRPSRTRTSTATKRVRLLADIVSRDDSDYSLNFVSDIAIFVLKRDGKLQLTN